VLNAEGSSASALVGAFSAVGISYEEDHRDHDRCNRRSRISQPRCAEARAEYAWYCSGGLRLPKLLIDTESWRIGEKRFWDAGLLSVAQ
jgi:hypothetical protein